MDAVSTINIQPCIVTSDIGEFFVRKTNVLFKYPTLKSMCKCFCTCFVHHEQKK